MGSNCAATIYIIKTKGLYCLCRLQTIATCSLLLLQPAPSNKNFNQVKATRPGRKWHRDENKKNWTNLQTK